MADETWRPGIEMDTLSGRSVWSIMGFVLLSVPPGLVLLLVLAVGMMVSGEGYGGSAFLTSVMVVILVDIAFALVTTTWFGFRSAEEVRAGDTTTANEFPHLPQVDPTTGVVIRLAGEPLLSREERRERIRLMQAAIAAGDGTDDRAPG
ncbi:hypothetical protein [Promicromonospora soli]